MRARVIVCVIVCACVCVCVDVCRCFGVRVRACVCVIVRACLRVSVYARAFMHVFYVIPIPHSAVHVREGSVFRCAVASGSTSARTLCRRPGCAAAHASVRRGAQPFALRCAEIYGFWFWL